MRVLIFGDSIAYGEYDSRGGWASRLHLDYLNQQAARLGDDLPRVFNLSIGGQTTRDIIKRLTAETEARKWGDEEISFVFAVGINDASLSESCQPVSSPKQYLKDLEELYLLAQKYGKRMMFVGLTAVEPAGPDDRYVLARIWQFEQVLRDFAASKKMPHVPLFEEFDRRIKQGVQLTLDGLHPNDEGHQIIYAQVKPALETLIG